MDTQLTIDLGQIAHELHLPLERIQRTVELLDEGNTIPFITRYRREQTGGLDEEQIRLIAESVSSRRHLLERKKTILKSIEAQGKLTPELQHEIEHANHIKRLEDLYLPYKVKKQSLATQARERGLEPLALEILNGDVLDLTARSSEFVNAKKELATVEDVLAGVQHIIAERMNERADLRGRLRRIFFRSGNMLCSKIEKPAETPESSETEPTTETVAPIGEPIVNEVPTLPEAAVEHVSSANASESETAAETVSEATTETTEPTLISTGADDLLQTGRLFEKPAEPVLAPTDKRKKKKKKKKVTDNAFKDYFNFKEPLSKLPPHRTLAINRGERANVLRVKIECDDTAMLHEAENVLLSPQHPQVDFLHYCLKDALQRLLVPSLEREARREFSEKAELHAVDVFVRNLRKLLLQPPVQGRRVLAIDPGFKSGCKMAAVDEWGNVLAHGLFYVVGRDDRKEKARNRIADMVRQHNLQVIAIGNGTGSRETEQLVAEMLSNELKDLDLAYVSVNEAGASVYSTSQLGREELPTHDPILRSAISIARRLLDPLSELVKINPANIGVGLYQHDMKAKNLKESLDAVVESCVNFVGVDVNSASPALLRYVSGLNALTARRIYEYRREHGPFANREELKKVPGIGEATFVQAAGFLKILGGDNPLDATWIHPESYEIAKKVLERFGSNVEELKQVVPEPPAPPVTPDSSKFGEGIVTEPVVESASEVTEVSAAQENIATPAADDALSQAQEGGLQTEEAIVTAALNETPTDDLIASHMPSAVLHTELTVHEPLTVAPPKANPIAEKLAEVDIPAVATELGVSPLLLEDLVISLSRPGRDPREELPPPTFRRGVMKLDDLSPGMELQGTVLNVVDFGAFVDIGLSDSALVHISRLADRFIRDPHEVVGIGDILKLWVVEVDRNRRRVSLTAIQPGSERPQRPRQEPRGDQERPPRGDRGSDRGPRSQSPPQAGGTRDQRGQRPQGDRPPGNRPPQGDRPPGDRPPRDDRGGRGDRGGDRRGGGRGAPRDFGPRVVERNSNKPKVDKPLSKAQVDGKKPLRSFSDLIQLMDKKKDEPTKPTEGNS
jgi:protein Tex